MLTEKNDRVKNNFSKKVKGRYSLAHQSSDMLCTESLVWGLLVAVSLRDLRSTLLGWTWQKHRKTVTILYLHFSSIMSCHHIEHVKLHPLHSLPHLHGYLIPLLHIHGRF